ncbi:LysR family substrate-binding domain-containing protein [Longispora sp. K20-0274]|uniref:LysR family substrate-binding domain-containing protein n=1 Tax=Longispora sp. K20-0274 TaxID=3088255 RepID=UPI00399B8188
MPDADDRLPQTFRLLIVPGVTMDKWSRVWSERLPRVDLRLLPTEHDQLAPLLAGDADAGLVRLPVDQDTFHAIPLYTEATVVVLPRDHELAESPELTLADLAGQKLTQPADDVLDWTGASAAPAVEHRPATVAAAVEYVAASVGVLVVPQSLARLHNRRDITYRVVTDAPQSTVALVWRRDEQTDLVEEMIGIVRGRTANSTRGRTQPQAPAAEPAKRSGEPGRRSAEPARRAGARRGGTGAARRKR